MSHSLRSWTMRIGTLPSSRSLGPPTRCKSWVDASRWVLPGSLASDALDQALGLLDEMAKGRAASLAATVNKLLDVLPPSLD